MRIAVFKRKISASIFRAGEFDFSAISLVASKNAVLNEDAAAFSNSSLFGNKLIIRGLNLLSSHLYLAIHELAHVYFTQLRFNRIEYDLRAMGEKFIKEHGISVLSKYAHVNIYKNDWEEVVCEIIAAYGRRGQFNKITELLNQETINTKKGGI